MEGRPESRNKAVFSIFFLCGVDNDYFVEISHS